MKPIKVIFNADDYGLSKGVNLGVAECFHNGVVRSATLMANMDEYDHAVKTAPKGLGIGVHLNITAGRALGTGYKTITDSNGNFIAANNAELEKMEIDPNEVEKEFTLQIEKLKKSGINITHFDGHHHAHILPNTIQVTTVLAKKYDMYVRLFEPIAGVKSIVFDRDFFGENVTHENLEKTIKSVTANTEIMCHPAYLDHNLLEASKYSTARTREMQILTSQKIKDMFDNENLVLANYGEL